MDFRIESSPPPRLEAGLSSGLNAPRAPRASMTPLQKLASVQPSRATTAAASPALNGQPVSAPVTSDRLFFSSQSTRAQVERFVQDKTTPSGLAFEFLPSSAPWRRLLPQRQVALTIYRRQTRPRLAVEDERPRRDRKRKRGPRDEKDAKAGQTPVQVRMYRLHYAPVARAPLLIEAMKLDFDKLPAPEDAAKPNVMLTRSGVLIPHRQFRRLGVERRARPRVEKALLSLRSALPNGALGRWARIGPKGRVTLLEQYDFDPAFEWRDGEGRPLKAYHLERLPNGVIAEIFRKERLAEVSGALRDPALRKRLREQILAEVERMEAQGLALKTTPSLAPVGVLSAGQIARVAQQGADKNPFVKLSAHFQALRAPAAATASEAPSPPSASPADQQTPSAPPSKSQTEASDAPTVSAS